MSDLDRYDSMPRELRDLVKELGMDAVERMAGDVATQDFMKGLLDA